MNELLIFESLHLNDSISQCVSRQANQQINKSTNQTPYNC